MLTDKTFTSNPYTKSYLYEFLDSSGNVIDGYSVGEVRQYASTATLYANIDSAVPANAVKLKLTVVDFDTYWNEYIYDIPK